MNLTGTEISHALRYLTHELNGFPSWLETMYKAYPNKVLESVWRELNWQLANAQPNVPMHYILQDIVYHAPWLHSDLAPGIQLWIEQNPQADKEILRHCFQILSNGQIASEWFSALAQSKAQSTENPDELSTWYALWVDTEPETGITALKVWLNAMLDDDACLAAQQFITKLLGDRQYQGIGTFYRNFKTESFLKNLYILMHKYIKVQDDIHRADKGVYSPKLRDNAQDARSRLFNLLTEIPGKSTYIALRELAQDHPVPSHRPWMEKQAYERAEQDADIEPWSPKQVYEFSLLQEKEPESHKQLFDIGVLHLHDFKEWLERGNDSLYETYQRISNETEMRKVVASWLNNHANGCYTCAQENPLANDQRPDIWLQHPLAGSPVPIELKLLDKGWSGPSLCERLRNQLAGDYLREQASGCGIFLLIWQGSKSDRKWRVNGKLAGVSELQATLSNYWASISHNFLNVVDIEVIVIDLTLRANQSNY